MTPRLALAAVLAPVSARAAPTPGEGRRAEHPKVKGAAELGAATSKALAAL